MRRPLVIAAAAVLSGTLCGLTGIPVIWTWAAAVIPAAALVWFFIKNRGRKRPLFFVVLFAVSAFLAAYCRSSQVSARYDSEEYRAFFQKYEASNPGEFDYALYLKAMDIVNEEERKALKTRNRELEGPLEQILGDLNESASAILDANLQETDADIMKAMLLGNKTDMDETVQDLYRGSGISHLLAVSGLHVSLIGLGLFNLLRKRLKLSLIFSVLFSGTMVFLYVIFTGASASSIRAGAMFLLTMLSKPAGRKTDLSTSLCVAGAGLLLWHPYLITQSGFLLSFSAIFGIILSVEALRGRQRESAGKDKSAVAKKNRDVSGFLLKTENAFVTCISVTLATLPVIAASYYKAPLYSVLLNMAVIPLMSVVFLSGAAVLLFGVFSLLTAAVPYVSAFLQWLSAAAAAPGHFILKFYEMLASFSLKLPGAEVILGRPQNWQILLFYAALILVVLVCSRLRRFFAAAGVLAVFYLLAFPLLKVRESPDPYITVLDVGQGDSFHIHSGGTDILIDCGSSGYERAGSGIAENYFLSKGIQQLDVIIASHADSDHTNGICYLLSEESSVETDLLMLPYLAGKDGKYESLVASAKGVPVRYAERGTGIRGDGIECVCIYSETDPAAIADTNRESSVWLVTICDFRMLFTGDITAQEESEICRLVREENAAETGPEDSEGTFRGCRVDVLKCAHHGSRTASSREFLELLKPDAAVLSYGAGNRYGHPSEEVTDRLEALGIRQFKTPECGAITFRIGSSGYTEETFLKGEAGRYD